MCAPLLQRHGGDVERDVDARVLVLAREPEAVGDEGALRPPIGDVGEVPLHDLGFGVPCKLVPGVDEGLYRGGVDEVDGGEVEDDGAEDGARVGLVGLLAARGRVVPWSVLTNVTSAKWVSSGKWGNRVALTQGKLLTPFFSYLLVSVCRVFLWTS